MGGPKVIGGPVWGPKVIGGCVYGGAREQLFCLDARSGKELWTTTAPSDVMMTYGYEPVVANGTVYAVTEGLAEHSYVFCAYDADTGKLKWQTSVQLPFGASCYEIVAPAGKLVYVNDGYYLTAFDAGSGKTVWQYARRCQATLMPVLIAEHVICIEDGGILYALDTDSGKELWTFQVSKNREVYTATSSVYTVCPQKYSSENGLLFVYTQGNVFSGLHCLDAQTGDEKWSLAAEEYEVTGGKVYAVTDYWGSWVADAETGRVEWYLPRHTAGICKVVAGTVYTITGQYLRVINPGATPVQVMLPQFRVDEARASGLIDVEISGLPPPVSGLTPESRWGERVKVTFNRHVPHPIRITIPEGTMFISNDPHVENMVFRRVLRGEATVQTERKEMVQDFYVVPVSDFTIDLTGIGITRKNFLVEVYAVELGKESPTEATTFSLGSMCDPLVLAILKAANSLPPEEASYYVIQAAILSATSDISRAEISKRLPISEQAIEQARKLLQLAGINAEGKKLFTWD